MPIAPSGRVCKLGGSLLNKEFPLRPGIVLLGEYPLQFPKNLVFFPGDALPAFLEPVDGVALQARDDGLQTAEVFEHPQFLGNITPGLYDFGALVTLKTCVHEYGRDHPKRDRVELIDRGQNRGDIVAARPVAPPRPDGPQTLMGDQLLEDVGVHAGQLLGKVAVRHLREGVARPVISEVLARIRLDSHRSTVVVDGEASFCKRRIG